MRKRMELSAKRLLRNIMQVGLFENPYLDVDASNELVGSAEYMEIGYQAQLKSVVLLKNANGLLPIKNKQKVFIPMRRTEEGQNWFGAPIPAVDEIPVDLDVIKQYFDIAGTPGEADYAFAFINSPETKGYTQNTGYQPISLQYRPYTADNARKASIATPDDNRCYAGKTVKSRFEPHLDMVLELKKAMGDKPVIVFVETGNPFVPAEFEAAADAILLDFCVLPEVLMDIVTGKTEPSGLLPFAIPKDMETVEKHNEDVSFDIDPYKDSEGNHYGFAFGLNWTGVIKDSRTDKYKV
jgi:beta-glucosidase